MKKLFLLIFFLGVSNHLFSQIEIIGNEVRFSLYRNNYWGDWRTESGIRISGTLDDFIVYSRYSDHPSDYFFRLKIYGFTMPTKKELKNHIKTKTWWEYSGYVEYYVCDVYPTLFDCFKSKNRLIKKYDIEDSDYEKKLSALRASKMLKGESFNPIGLSRQRKSARIRIGPYKKIPNIYNIFIDNVGIALDLNEVFAGNKGKLPYYQIKTYEK